MGRRHRATVRGVEQFQAADVRRDAQWNGAVEASTNRGEAFFTAAAGLGLVCAVVAATGAWMLMTDPDRLMWVASAALALAGR